MSPTETQDDSSVCELSHAVSVSFDFSAEGMKAGNYGNLLVQIEQPRGEYAVTIAFLRLLTTLVKVATLCSLSLALITKTWVLFVYFFVL